ncbi:S-protein homolog 21 [Ricinus communis]|uniref:S-protein homolog n=1 Tax=Ricinus communis TaxID=3988 RepID=B9RTI3_RICCO|nr:S-protein homolog 21 [Ricinus communis]EEF45215.1 RNA binding protein, putative [Ricinus communis]|eukprot:XP_002517052.1 S-protein homolog 21 [Ricinus communis]
MRAVKSCVNVIVLLVLLILAMGRCCLGIGERYHVHIINDLTRHTLNVHCKSKDDDLGPHLLQLGEEFHFTFRVNFWGTTLFWCNFKWGKNHGGDYHIFWYRDDLLYDCGYEQKNCIWSARNSGMWLMNIPDGIQFYKRYDWQW